MCAWIAAAAATITYGLHHFSPADPHHLEGVAAVVIGVVIVVVSPVAIMVARRHPEPPMVLVPRDDAVDVRPYGALDDARFGAAVHAAELGHGFFVDLGPGFLRAYQRTFADSPHAVALVAEIDDHSVGMLVGVLRPARHARWVLQHRGVRLAAAGLASLAIRPVIAARFLRTRAVRYVRGWRHRRAQRQSAAEEAPYAILSHVAVLSGARRSGAGAALVRAFERMTAAAGIGEARLVTLPGQEGAGRFYRRLGWRAVGRTTTADDRIVESFRRSLPS
ncbi:MAG: GNAT family N-acetyltransferase [Solirubrobacteraceae bacterium]|nr:GNAT family N-acetyltransferase [Solirubrobacteraceae bacterium]